MLGIKAIELTRCLFVCLFVEIMLPSRQRSLLRRFSRRDTPNGDCYATPPESQTKGISCTFPETVPIISAIQTRGCLLPNRDILTLSVRRLFREAESYLDRIKPRIGTQVAIACLPTLLYVPS